jgi:3-hydroxypropanoate dehydrogenase
MTDLQSISKTEDEWEERLSEAALDRLFRTARTHSAWLPKPVSDELLREVYDLAKWGPTSANLAPMRILFLRSEEAKARLKPALSAGNVDKTMSAPVTAVIAYDLEFYEHQPRLFPHMDVRPWFQGNSALIEETAFRNGTLQSAYFIMAARAHGLDCGPMSGFDGEKVNAEFFPDGKWKVNFLCNLGYGDFEKLFPRLPRLEFDDVCTIL